MATTLSDMTAKKKPEQGDECLRERQLIHGRLHQHTSFDPGIARLEHHRQNEILRGPTTGKQLCNQVGRKLAQRLFEKMTMGEWASESALDHDASCMPIRADRPIVEPVGKAVERLAARPELRLERVERQSGDRTDGTEA